MEDCRAWSEMNKNLTVDQFKKNDETFRNTMERIFQKYSNLDDPGPDICLNTMILTTGKGSVPLNSNMAEKELQHLRNRLKERSLRALDSPQEENTVVNEDLDVSATDLERSTRMDHSNNSLWCGSGTSQLSLKSANSSRSCLWSEPSQPEEKDQDLEKTLSSHGSTLLDVYPSMLNQIGEAYRRQHVNEMASAVLRRYHRRRWQSSQAQHRNHAFINSSKHMLNRIRRRSLAVPNQPQDNNIDPQKSTFKNRGSSQHKRCSPVKSSSNTSLVSTACFYSPRRDDVGKWTGEENGSCWTGQHSNSELAHRPVRVLDLSMPLSSVSSSLRSPSPSPDLNQTYIVEPVPLPRSYGDPERTWSPLKMARMASLASQGGSLVNAPPYLHHSGLRRDQVNPPASSPQKALISSSHLAQMRSPLKAKMMGLEHNQQTSLSYHKQALPVIHTSEMCRSPYKDRRYPFPRQQFSPHQENPTKQMKRQPFISSHYSPSSISEMPSRQIDAEFMNLYHHFICRSTNPTSSCHLCKRRSGVQRPAASSTRMSALSLTPVRCRLNKRHREPEIVESLRFKRFRESCSPRRTTQFWPQQQHQQTNAYVNTAMAEPDMDKYTWNRALFLQCPSPGFLRAIRQHQKSTSGSHGKRRLDLHTQHYSQSWRDSLRRSGAGEGENSNISEAYAGSRSPMRTWDQGDILVSPRLSRRRLLYDPLQ